MDVQTRSESINKHVAFRMCVATVLLAISGIFVVVACAVPAFSAGTPTFIYEVDGSDYGGSVGYGIWGVGGYLNEDSCDAVNAFITLRGGEEWSCSDVVSYHCEYATSILTVLLVFVAFVLACHGSRSRRPKPCLTAALVAAAAVLSVVPFALWELIACVTLVDDPADLECGRSWSYALQVCGFLILIIALFTLPGVEKICEICS
ncbi:hypothetical protein EMIHUDRAFT_227277 [Emiliania huxleyi CCMP1516]|uniref:G-protein coupled receptors family 1 profile domain-containing protein n=2 Tax=Emiliania huxleyi TaxID=2903 RepID=A0A0D3KJ13_EMIH1|nr:hypothetical protein EMIHUDRAFT_227277 [Emiliania huxleyi CCMP1516]EOD35748.1 hypothetical protein EMIHUDRAFT_227277 [Emiliania huxleyi CCMP1516]|eukprot:XP_005788177.1 hypothetical protein EMIHUDRAFT_227277 [Emiliania huxleyi CCMP1516]